MPETKEWTLMFYFASDNPLAPGIVSQLKAIKQAGFHHEANVVAQFDPQPHGTPTHIFDVNYIKKLRNEQPRIGYIGASPADPYVHNLVEDKLWREGEQAQLDRKGRSIRQQFKNYLGREYEIDYDPPEPPLDRTPDTASCPDCGLELPHPGGACAAEGDGGPRTRELSPRESLKQFLDFCRESYPARHYVLFILGHGVVVGHDVFLYDENAERQSLTLTELGRLLADFKGGLGEGAEFELVSFHSCSLSSLEVAYELHGTANYMLASQGPAFVGSWPYRQILMRLLSNVDELRWLERDGRWPEARANVKQLLRDIFKYCYHNSTDYLVAGYSFDLCLSNLNRVPAVKKPLRRLAAALRAGLDDDLVKALVLLAHWEAQSQWQESYTDLRDFCLCLVAQYQKLKASLNGKGARALGPAYAKLEEISGRCEVLQSELKPEYPGGEEKLVVSSHFAGPGHQYSHGLSVYFPWSQPAEDRPIMEDYAGYKFAETGWLGFLKDYFDKTMRRPRKAEDGAAARRGPGSTVEAPDDEPADEMLLEDMRSLIFGGDGRPGAQGSPADTLKVGPRDPTGDECTCGSIKNYPRDTRDRTRRHLAAGAQEKYLVPASRRTTIQQ